MDGKFKKFIDTKWITINQWVGGGEVLQKNRVTHGSYVLYKSGPASESNRNRMGSFFWQVTENRW